MGAVTIPVMAKCRIGHFAEAQILQSLGADFIDESEGSVRNLMAACSLTKLLFHFCCYCYSILVLTPADDENHIDKTNFTVPFVCGARNLGEALRRIAEGAAMIRTKGEAGTGKKLEYLSHVEMFIYSECKIVYFSDGVSGFSPGILRHSGPLCLPLCLQFFPLCLIIHYWWLAPTPEAISEHS